jgi:hypothetical protein
MTFWDLPWGLISTFTGIIAIILLVDWKIKKKTASYIAEAFSRFETKPSSKGFHVWLWHRGRFHDIDFNNREPRGGQFHCLTCDRRWWW